MSLRLENIQSGQVTLETSTNLKTWKAVQSYSIGAGDVAVLRLNILPGEPGRFYRLRE
jgi:hypothetical protein